ALGDVERAPLELDHVGELGIVDPGRVQRLPGQVVAVEEAVRIGPPAEEPPGDLLELPKDGARDIGAVLLHLELGVDPRGLPVLEADLYGIDVVRAVAGGGLEGELHAAGESCFANT